jgi:hypothetical protein
MDGRILERFQLLRGCDIADTNVGVTTCDKIDMSKLKRLLIVLNMGDGTAANDLDIYVYQSDDASGTSTAVLNCLQTGRIFTKYAADFTAEQALTAWTQVTQATADERYEPDDNGESTGLICLEVRPEDLSDGYRYVYAYLTQAGAAKYANVLYFGELKDPNSPTLTPSCI